MSNLADRVATEHGRGMIASSEHGAFTVFHCQGCGAEAATAAHHVARKTEAAVREQVARDIEAQIEDAILYAEDAAFVVAARIAREGVER